MGLGTGSTASHVVRRLGELEDVRGIPTSAQTANLAEDTGMPLVTLGEARPGLTEECSGRSLVAWKGER